MALAILDLLTAESGQVKFGIDTGTNKFYYLKIGKSVSEREGLSWVDEVTFKTPLRINENSENLFNSAKEISVPAGYFNDKSCYIQLFSFKNKDGKSPAFSGVKKVPVGFLSISPENKMFSLSESINGYNMTHDYFYTHRNIPHADPVQYSKEASIEDILSNIVKIAAPIVAGLLKGNNNNATGDSSNSSRTNVPQIGMLNTILDAILHGLAHGQSTPVLSTTHSISHDNRFINEKPNLSNQFIFGIDDALLGTLAGPILQLIPQLVTSANQLKVQNKQATNKLITDLVADTNRRLMLQDFLNQQATSANNSNINLNQLLQLLQQIPAAGGTTAAAGTISTPSTASSAADTHAVSQSLSFDIYPRTLSTQSILSFETAPKINFMGRECAVYSKNSDIKLKLKLNVVEPVPKNPLPKAIYKFSFKDDKHNILFEKEFKEKNITPNSAKEFLFSSAEIKDLTGNTPLNVYAQMRWLTTEKKEHNAFGFTDIIFAVDYFLKEQGESLIGEKELTDMNVYRAFWNKVWESPVLDKINTNKEGFKKYHWELNANLRYSFVYSAENLSNGIMETKILAAKQDPDSLEELIEGRMKGGIELSIAELNKLCSLWDNQPLLIPEKLNALKTKSFTANIASEFIYNVKLKGSERERGIVWVIPVLKLFNITLNKIKSVDQWGQVTEVEEEKIQFPLPVSARILGIKTA